MAYLPSSMKGKSSLIIQYLTLLRNKLERKSEMEKRSFVENDEWIIEDYLEVDDKAVVRYTGYMTYAGGWYDIPSMHQRVKETGIMIIRFKMEK